MYNCFINNIFILPLPIWGADLEMVLIVITYDTPIYHPSFFHSLPLLSPSRSLHSPSLLLSLYSPSFFLFYLNKIFLCNQAGFQICSGLRLAFNSQSTNPSLPRAKTTNVYLHAQLEVLMQVHLEFAQYTIPRHFP